jgi:hypothetical protein
VGAPVVLLQRGSLVVVAYQKVPVLDAHLWKELCNVSRGEVLIVLSDNEISVVRSAGYSSQHVISGYVKVLTTKNIVGMIYRDSVSILQKA